MIYRYIYNNYSVMLWIIHKKMHKEIYNKINSNSNNNKCY